MPAGSAQASTGRLSGAAARTAAAGAAAVRQHPYREFRHRPGHHPAARGRPADRLVFALKQAVGTDLIAAREQQLWQHVLHRWAVSPSIEVLGNQQAARLSIISFRIRHGPQYLHHNFVVALLNDLFGIQARGGCSCAGPYGHRLLAIGPARRRGCGVRGRGQERGHGLALRGGHPGGKGPDPGMVSGQAFQRARRGERGQLDQHVATVARVRAAVYPPGSLQPVDQHAITSVTK